MRPTIIRCPSCFLYVYADAKSCHGCGERIGRRAILRRGSWIFIVLAVSAFAIGRSIDLEQDKHSRLRYAQAVEVREDIAKRFLNAWLVGDDQAVVRFVSGGEAFATRLAKLRDLYPDHLPADTIVVGIRVSDEGTELHGQEGKRESAPVVHDAYSVGEDPTYRRRASAPAAEAAATRLRIGRQTRWSWYLNDIAFEAEFSKGGTHYTLTGHVCMGTENVYCLTLDSLRGIEGLIEPKG